MELMLEVVLGGLEGFVVVFERDDFVGELLDCVVGGLGLLRLEGEFLLCLFELGDELLVLDLVLEEQFRDPLIIHSQ